MKDRLGTIVSRVRASWIEVLAVAATVLTGGLLPDVLTKRAVFDWADIRSTRHGWWALVVRVVFAVIFVGLTAFTVDKLRRRRQIHTRKADHAASHLIIPVSFPNGWELIGSELKVVSGGKEWSFDELSSNNAPGHINLAQPLRALKHHSDKRRSTVRAVHLLGSETKARKDGEGDVKGSHDLCNQLAPALTKWLGGGVTVTVGEAIDFGSVKACQTAAEKQLTCWLERRRSSDRVAEQSIVVDITAGQKPLSVGFTLATLNKSVRLQYVDGEEVRIFSSDLTK